jgi:ribosomal protein S18 acetylase RimI-like enzyme
MIQIKLLKGIHFDRIFKAFNAAFQDYEIQLDKAELQSMLERRGFLPDLSFAAFNDDEIVAFTLNGIGTFNGVETAYDTGTGTIKEIRGQGLASQRFEYSIPFLKKVNITQYLLEVLQHNTKAVSIYQKLGFEVRREFNYFVQTQNEISLKLNKTLPSYKIKPTELNQCESMSDFQDFHPSWQNSFKSISRDTSGFKFIGAYQEDDLLGFCIFEPSSGDITQISVDKAHRRKGIASRLFRRSVEI